MRIKLKPPVAVAKAAVLGLSLHKLFKRGGTTIGWARAEELISRRTLSPETIYRMVSYFARHEVDKKGKNFFNKERPSNGYIAWQLWGGDAGKVWAEKIKKQLKQAGW